MDDRADAGLSREQRALLALRRMQEKVDALQRAAREPLAVVGMACRFPGAANDLSGYWRLLQDGLDGTCRVPASRWHAETVADPEGRVPSRGGFLQEVQLEEFDAAFFGITPPEARELDPQQRQLLEVTWEALEDAAQAPYSLMGSRTGVFVGIGSRDYEMRRSELGLPMSPYQAMGTEFSTAAGRTSHILGLRGPTMSVATACSSSLVTVHWAAHSLRSGECDWALVGGTNLTLIPWTTQYMALAGTLDPDGRCKTFDARANGYARGEGCGVLVLRRLSDAISDGARIYATVVGTAVNHDGQTSTLTAPSGPSQQEVYRQALSQAHLSADTVQYVEAHGTGTPLGDPIEMQALGMVYGVGRGDSERQRLAVGSAKTNVGHLEAASGVVGLIKMVLALHHEQIPPHLNLESINPYIDLEQLQLFVTSEGTPWPRGGGVRTAGVSSFGWSGTNAHLVVQEPPKLQKERAEEPCLERPQHLLALSARSQGALRDLAQRYAAWLQSHPSEALPDVCYTAYMGRARFEQRLALVDGTTDGMARKLGSFAEGGLAGVVTGSAEEEMAPEIAFLFTGHGSNYVGMGRALYESNPVFREALDRCAQILREYLRKPLLEVLFHEATGALDQMAYAQPALFALQYALTEVWRSWGITPGAVLGHSAGELTAACAAGVFSLEDGLRLIAERGRLMQTLPPDGKMATVFAREEDVTAALEVYAGAVVVATVNEPEHVVISGERAKVEAAVAELAARSVRTQLLDISVAGHSPLMDPILDSFAEAAATVRYSRPTIDVVSNVTGRWITEHDATYWRTHLRQPVRFVDGMRALEQRGYKVFVEVGPRAHLLGMGASCLDDDSCMWVPSLRRSRNDWEQMAEGLGALWANGVEANWAGFEQGNVRRRISLPSYPFERQRHWLDAPKGNSTVARLGSEQVLHPLLGRKVEVAVIEEQVVFETWVGAGWPAYLADHQVHGRVVMPGAAYVEMGLAVGRKGLGLEGVAVKELDIEQPLILGADSTQLQVVVSESEGGKPSFAVYSRAEGGDRWQRHAQGMLVTVGQEVAQEAESFETVQQRCTKEVSVEAAYQGFAERGIDYGPAFQVVRALSRGHGEVLGRLGLEEGADDHIADYILHPSLLDGCFQLLAAAVEAGSDIEKRTHVPVGVERCVPGEGGHSELWCHCKLRGAPTATLIADFTLYDARGTPVGMVRGLQARPMALSDLLKGEVDVRAFTYELRWREQEQPVVALEQTGNGVPGPCVIVADGQGVGSALSAELERLGRPAEVVSWPEADADEATASQRVAQAIELCEQRAAVAVVYLKALDATAAERVNNESLQADSHRIVGGALQLVQGLQRLVDKPALWLVSQGAQAVGGEAQPVQVAQAPLWGFGRTVALEAPDLQCRLVDLDPGQQTIALGKQLAQLVCGGSAEGQLAYRDGRQHVVRLVRKGQGGVKQLQVPKAAGYRLEISEKGALSNLELRAAERMGPGRGQVAVRVRATALNFRDVLNALGTYPGDAGPLGGDCAGVVVAVGEGVSRFEVGDAVMGFASGAFSSPVVTDARLLVHKPPQFSYEQAASIPSVFLTAHYGLNYLAKLSAGERVLVHAAAGGVGLAAVQLAQRAGAEVIGSCGSERKRRLLRRWGVEHLVDSRSLGFAEDVQGITGGQGVAVVLNSLAGEFIEKSFEVLQRQGGRFVEIGKTGIWSDDRVQGVVPGAGYYTVALDELCVKEPELVQQMLRDVVGQFERRELKPLPVQRFELEETVAAFRYMQQAKHVGRIVVSHPNEASELVQPGATYLVTGGLGGMGLEVARWLVRKGARHVALMGRGGVRTDRQREVLSELEAAEARVRVLRGDVSSGNDVAQALDEIAETMPPLRGVLHAAGVLEDAVLGNQSWETFEKVMGPKVWGGWHLHQQTLRFPLDFFVCFSSFAALGSAGQSNHAAANAFLDALCQYRQWRGLCASSVNWGAVGEVGAAAALDEALQRRLTAAGMTPLALTQVMAVLEETLRAGSAQILAVEANWDRLADGMGGREGALSELVKAEPRQRGQEGSLLARLRRADPDQRRALVLDEVRRSVADVLGLLDPTVVGLQAPFADAGVDSLLALELRNTLRKRLAIPLPTGTIFEHPSVEALSHFLADEVVASGGESAPGVAIASPPDTCPETRWLPYRRPADRTKVKLFCFHGIGDAANVYESWQRNFGGGVDVCAVELPGRWARTREPLLTRVDQMVAQVIEGLGPLFVDDFAFVGHSAGGILAFEVARQLRRDGRQLPSSLGLLSIKAPHIHKPARKSHELPLHHLPEEDLVAILRGPGWELRNVLEHPDFREAFLPILRADLEALEQYEFRHESPFDFPFWTVLGDQDRAFSQGEVDAWRDYTIGAFSLSMVPAGHRLLSEEALLKEASMRIGAADAT